MSMRKKYIDLREWKINPVESYKVKIGKKKWLLGIGLASMSLIIPDGSIGIVLSSIVLSPLSFSKSLNNRYAIIRNKLIKKYYQWKN